MGIGSKKKQPSKTDIKKAEEDEIAKQSQLGPDSRQSSKSDFQDALESNPSNNNSSNSNDKSGSKHSSPPLSKNASTADIPHDAAENMEVQDTSAVGKVKALLGMMSKFIGVKDIVNLRISLPASLLDPISNLEYWNYMDRPDIFAAIPDSDLPIDRMLNVIKWWFSKDTKWLSGKISKPYNSILGEQFFCHWDVDASSIHPDTSPHVAILQEYTPAKGHHAQHSETATLSNNNNTFRVHCITEQISHRPPVSAFYYYCKQKGVIARGVDHICAKFSGTYVKVYPGDLNKGIYVTLESRDNEEYQLTHPVGCVYGWLKASLWTSVCEETVISCPKSGLRAILEYVEEPYFGKAKFLVQGKIFKYDPVTEAEPPTKKLSKIPDDKVLCHINGCWKGHILYKKTDLCGSTEVLNNPDVAKSNTSLASFLTANTTHSANVHANIFKYPISKSFETLLDLTGTSPVEKKLRPIEQQDEWESRKIWQNVTDNILSGNFNEATNWKRQIEDKQRQMEKERHAKNEHYHSKWFGFLDTKAVPSCVVNESKVLVEGNGESGKNLILGKPFLLKSAIPHLPWTSK